MKVYVFECVFQNSTPENRVTYAAIAQYPYRVVAKILMDATRERPMTEIGRVIQSSNAISSPSVNIIRQCSLPTALRTLREYSESHENVVTEYSYSTIDDCDTIQTPMVRTMYKLPTPEIVICWGSDQSILAFEDLFFNTHCPETFLQGSLCDMLVNAFRHFIVESRSPLGHSIAFNKTTRTVLTRQKQYPYFASYPLFKFCSLAVPWMARAMEYVVSRIIHGCRNDANRTYQPDVMIERAYAVYREMHTIEGTKTWIECMTSDTKRYSVAIQVKQSFATCITNVSRKESSLTLAFEKLRRMVPDHHPMSPDFAVYKRRKHVLDGVESAKQAFQEIPVKSTKKET